MGTGKELPEEEAERVAEISGQLLNLMNRSDRLSPYEGNAIIRSRARADWDFRTQGEGEQERGVMDLKTKKGSLVYTSGYEATEATVAIASPSLVLEETVVLGITSMGMTDRDLFVISFRRPPEAGGKEAERMNVFIDKEGAFSTSSSEGL